MRERIGICVVKGGVTWKDYAVSADTVEFKGLRRWKNVKLLWSLGGTDSEEAIVWRRDVDEENNDRRLMGGDAPCC